MKRIAGILVFSGVLAFASGPLVAKTPDGKPPAEESVCDGLTGAAFGVCNAYCEATDCDGTPKASARACARLHANWVRHTGLQEFPCDCQEPFIFNRAAGCVCGLTENDCAAGEQLDPQACECVALPTATSTPTATPTQTATPTATDVPTATPSPTLPSEEQDTIRCLCCDPEGNCTPLENICIPTRDCRSAEDACEELCGLDNTVEDFGCVPNDCLDGSETATPTPTATETPPGPTDTPTLTPVLPPEEQDTIRCLCCDPEGNCTPLENICIPTMDCRSAEDACDELCGPDNTVEDFGCVANDCLDGSETATPTPTPTETASGPTDTPTPTPVLLPEEQDTISCLCCDPEGTCTPLENICIPTIECRDIDGACEEICPPDSVVEALDCTPNDCSPG